MRRWAIYIDIEGFSAIYPNNDVQALVALGAVMEGIYFIGTTVCAETSNRLFVHQTGDGFVVVSESAQGGPQLPIAIATILMRRVLLVGCGCLTKAGISEGDFADIQGCYPEVIRQNSDGRGVVRLGRGLMRIFPVMGTALINAHGLTTRTKGSLLLLDDHMASELVAKGIVSARCPDFAVIDWIHADIPEIRQIAERAGIVLPQTNVLEQRLVVLVEAAKNSVPDEWVKNTLTWNGCGRAGNV